MIMKKIFFTIVISLLMLGIFLPWPHVQSDEPIKNETINETKISIIEEPPNQTENHEIAAISEPTKKEQMIQDAVDFASSHEYVRHVYDCDQFSRDVRVLLLNKYKALDIQYVIKPVNCSEECSWASCGRGSLHMFLWIRMDNMTKPFYLEATTGYEISEDEYWCYNIKPGERK
jgi:hypothetical protein